jgi:hypothetical protein
VWWGFALDPDARGVSEHLMLRSGEWARGRRTHESLKRGGVPPEGAYNPRAGRSFGVTAPGPSSEKEFRPRGAEAGRLLGR